MKRIKYLLILVLALVLFVGVGCKKENGDKPEPEPEKEVFDVVEVKESYEQEYEYDEFELSFLKIRLVYEDGTYKDIPVTEDMVDDKDLAKLTKPGNPRININYQDSYQFTYVVKLIDSSDLDKDLNKDGKYNAVVKAIRDKDKGVINFILEPKDGVCAIAFGYTFDASIMQVSGGTLNTSLNGKGSISVNGNKITFAYTAKDANITTETLLFTVNYTGDFRNSNLRVDDTFTNTVYTYNAETGYSEMLTNILYHASIK